MIISSTTETGYISEQYAKAFAHAGKRVFLPASGGYILVSQIENVPYLDGASVYPLFSCRAGESVIEDLRRLESDYELVSIRLVSDPLSSFDITDAGNYFSVIREYKQHCLVRLQDFSVAAVPDNHKRNIKRWRNLHGQIIRYDGRLPEPARQDWCSRLYPNLVARHNITRAANFPIESLTVQLEVPGLVTFAAYDDESHAEALGMCLFYIQGQNAYYHLGAYSDEGYASGAAFGIFSQAIEYFQGLGLRYVFLGSGAGTESPSQGLFRFKSGWSNEFRTNHILGRISRPDIYERLTAQQNNPQFFPAYRK